MKKNKTEYKSLKKVVTKKKIHFQEYPNCLVLKKEEILKELASILIPLRCQLVLSFKKKR